MKGGIQEKKELIGGGGRGENVVKGGKNFLAAGRKSYLEETEGK